MGHAISAASAALGPAARLAAGPLIAVVLVLLVAVLRLSLGGFFPGLSPFALFYPAILMAGLLGGAAGAVVALALSLLLSLELFLRPLGAPMDPLSRTANVVIFVLTGALLAAVGARLRTLMARHRLALSKLGERELRYRTLFEGVTEGFGLLEGVRDESGAVVDLRLIEANPALLRMFGADASVIGLRAREIVKAPGTGYIAASGRALDGEPLVFLHRTPRRWFEIRMNRVGENLVAQIIVDVTERKLAELRQTELFDELNHRVKNNLAMVSAMLSMQARSAENPEVQGRLEEAVARIQTIADVHASLYRSSRKDDVDFSGYLVGLCDRLAHSVVDPERVRIEVAAEPVEMPLDKAVALGLVVNELVTNAAKHAYPDGASGVVKVGLCNTPNGLTLSVADTGQGLPPSGEGAGLGMRLVRSLVQQVGGFLHIQQNGGLRFAITLGSPEAGTAPDTAQAPLL